MSISEQEFFKELHIKGLNLTDQQKRAVVHNNGPLLLLAVPGAGKTTVLITRLAYLIRVKNIDPSRILCLTFGRAAAKEMQERFTKSFGDSHSNSQDIRFSTIHSFAYEVVRSSFYQKGIRFEVIEELKGMNSKSGILRRLYEKNNHQIPNEEQLEELQNAICYVKNTLIKPEKLETDIKNFPSIFKEYEEHKRSSQPQLLDYDDMLAVALQILKDSSEVLESYRKRYDYILIDESQDTSLLQHKIIELIGKPLENLFVVGDDDQSIFGFRAAEPKYLLDFQKVYPRAQILRMEQNFRSTPEIVSTSCQFIRTNRLRFDKAMFTKNPEGQPLRLAHFKDSREQYQRIIQELKQMKDLSKVGVLYRNNLSAVGLVEALSRANLSFFIKGAGTLRFFSHWAVQDVLNFLRLSFSDKSLPVFERLWTKLPFRISKAQLEYLMKRPIEGSIFDILKEYPNTPEKVKQEYKDIQRKFKELNTLTPAEAIYFIRHDLEYNKTIGNICNSLGFSREHIFNLLDILTFIAQGERTIVDFANRLGELEEQIHSSYQNKDKNAITLSTIHYAKGLEWEQVYLLDLIEGVIPESAAVKSEEEGRSEGLEEERRLFYVGMTRAKSHLTLCSLDFYHRKKAKTSRFVREVNNLLVGKSSLASKMSSRVTTDEWGVGLVIEHKTFGQGVIVEEDHKVLIIRFNNGTERTFLKEICKKEDLIWAV